MVWGGRREEGSGWGTHVYKLNNFLLKKKKRKKKEKNKEETAKCRKNTLRRNFLIKKQNANL